MTQSVYYKKGCVKHPYVNLMSELPEPDKNETYGFLATKTARLGAG
ncbi:hypothetical protein VIBNIAM115_460003 [Vibrio nigripulchritudo AM115]|nr:hypothetical protein VIBNIAM115_460003 [Vibrio nigripulchritudo AM115]